MHSNPFLCCLRGNASQARVRDTHYRASDERWASNKTVTPFPFKPLLHFLGILSLRREGYLSAAGPIFWSNGQIPFDMRLN